MAATPEEIPNYDNGAPRNEGHNSFEKDDKREQASSNNNRVHNLPSSVEDDDMELDSPDPVSNEPSQNVAPKYYQESNQSYQQDQNQYDQSYQQGQNQYNQSYQQGQNQYDQSYQQGQNQYDQSYQQGQNQYDQSYQQGQNQYDQSYQQGQNQHDQSYQQGQNQYDQSYQQGQNQYDQSYQQRQSQYDQSYQQSQNQYDQSYQQGQNQYSQSYQQGSNQYSQSYQQGSNQYDQSYHQGQNQYDQSYQQGSNQYNQSYQQGSNQYDQSYQQGSNQYDQSYQQGSNQYDQSYQQGSNQYDQSYQQGSNQYSQSYQQGQTGYAQSYSYYYPHTYMTPLGGTNYMWASVPWQPLAPPTRGGEWPQWTGVSSTKEDKTPNNKQSTWDPPKDKHKTDTYNAVPPPDTNKTKEKVAKPTTSVTTPTTTMTTPTNATKSTSDEANTPIRDWPPGLQEYMVRAFECCKSEEEKTQVEQYLKIEINEMFRDKRVWQVDWSNEPLPLDKLKRQAQKRKSRWDTPSLSPATPLSQPSPPPPTTNQKAQEGVGIGKRKRRAKRGRGGKFFIDRSGANNNTMTEEDKFKVGQRAQRFAKGQEGNRKFKPKLMITELLKSVSVSGEENDWDSSCIEGTCRELEKRYLRLTSAPDPSTVRPEHILHQSLSLVMTKLEEGRDYRYLCEQLKSIRQDLTVQGIRNPFTVQVYEHHGRIALQHGDWSEFNQCQSQLSSLYHSEGLPGCKAEFLAYRILYYMMTNDSSEFVGVFRELTPELWQDPCVLHAMEMRKAWSFGNYRRFFRLYSDTPNFGRHLIDLFMERERKSALKIITKAYRPSISIEYISSLLNFSSLQECREFLVSKCEVVLDQTELNVDCRLTFNKLK